MKGKIELKTMFKEVYDRQFARVYKLAVFLTGSAVDAEDIAQTVFVKAWEKQPRFRDFDHENAWFMTVTRNQCLDLRRSSYKKGRVDLSDIPEPQVAFSSREDDELWLALKELPFKYREIVYLHYYEGYSLRELARALHRRESTLQTQLAAARKQLRELLREEDAGQVGV